MAKKDRPLRPGKSQRKPVLKGGVYKCKQPPAGKDQVAIRVPGSVKFAGKATVKLGAKGALDVRIIQDSPYSDPKLLAEARKFERELKAKGVGDRINPDQKAPLILPIER